jgi:hypothetical protein
MPLWEEYPIVNVAEAMLWVGREVDKLRYFLEVQAGLERAVAFHHNDEEVGDELTPSLGLSFDWRPIQRYLDPDVVLIMGSDGNVSHPIYAIVPSQRSVVELDVHATTEIPRAGTDYLLARYMKEIEILIPSVSVDRQGEMFKHLRALMRIIKTA